MSNNKQSSVEFLWDELKPFLPANYTVDESVKILSILEQAKAMHKEEIMDSNFYGQRLHAKSVTNIMMEDNAEQYYNETFGQ